MTGRKFLSPPPLALPPQSDHGSAACAETEVFFQYGPPQSFFQLSWLALQKARREVGARTDDRAQISQPPRLLWLAPQSDHGSAARAETEAFFQHGLQSFFEFNSTGSPYKKHVAERAIRGGGGLEICALILAPTSRAIRSRECRVRGN